MMYPSHYTLQDKRQCYWVGGNLPRVHLVNKLTGRQTDQLVNKPVTLHCTAYIQYIHIFISEAQYNM